MDGQAFWLTVRLSALVAAILVVMGLPLAYWITYSRWRWKFLAEAVFALPIVLPPTVLGFYVLVALGPHSPLGRGWEALTGHTLAFTFEGLLIGSIVYSFPFAVQPFAASFCGGRSAADGGFADPGSFPNPEHSFASFCPCRLRPGDRRGPEFRPHHGRVRRGADGRRKYPGVTRTVSIDIYDKVQAINYSGANATALVLLAISFATLSVVYAMNRRVWIWKQIA